MPKLALCSLAFAVTTMMACADTKESGPASGTDTPEQTGGAGSGAGTGAATSEQESCGAGATRNTEGGFCIAMGEGSQPPAASGSESERRYEYASGESSVIVAVKKTPITDDAWTAAKGRLADEAVRQSGTTKSSTASASARWTEPDGRAASITVLKAADKLVECRAISRQASLLQACQSIRLF